NRIRHRRLDRVGQTCRVKGRRSNGVCHVHGAGEIGRGGRSRNRIRHRRRGVRLTCRVKGRSNGVCHVHGAGEIGRGGRSRNRIRHRRLGVGRGWGRSSKGGSKGVGHVHGAGEIGRGGRSR